MLKHNLHVGSPEPPVGLEAVPDFAPSGRLVADLARWAGAMLWGMLLVAATVLCWRRMAGALSTPLEPAALALVAALIAGAALGGRLAWKFRWEGRRAGLPARLAPIGLSATLVVIGAVLSPGTSAGGLTVLWGILAAEEFWAWGPRGWRQSARNTWSWPFSPQRAQEAPPRSEPRATRSGPALEARPGEEVTQQMVRSVAPDGSEVLSGWVRVPMAPGQRTGSVHLAFCPPFSRTPRVEVEQLEGAAARIKTVQLLPHGARFDLKLAALSGGSETVLLRFSAEAGPGAPDADPAARIADHSPET